MGFAINKLHQKIKTKSFTFEVFSNEIFPGISAKKSTFKNHAMFTKTAKATVYG